MALACFACGGETPRAETGTSRTTNDLAAPGAVPTLNTFITDSIQIDQFSAGGVAPDDANLFSGSDPADGTASVNNPPGGPGSYIDWQELVTALADHRLQDLNTGNKDPTSFPSSNECVNSSSVLSKMDLTYVAAANNTRFGYFAVQRSNNNGDAGYYWIFTQMTPHLVQGEAPCKGTDQRLTYDISPGDILMGGHFHPNGSPLLRFFKAKVTRLHVGAVDAINFNDATLWQEDSTTISAVAVNTTNSSAGGFGADGVIATAGSTPAGGVTVQPEIFAEAAVPLAALTNGNICGAQFYGSVITRSSGSGGTSPDLKDLSGPAVFNFRTLTAQASMTASCDNTVSFSASSITPGQAVSCQWTIDGAPGPSTCDGTLTLSQGTHTASVAVTDPTTGCVQTIANISITVAPSIVPTATLTPSCTLGYDFSSTVSGGAAPLTYAWTFTNSASGASSAASGSNTALSAGAVNATLTVSDSRGCTGSTTASANILNPLTANAALTGSCASSFGYGGSGSGGSGNYSYNWAFSGPGFSANSSSASGTVATGPLATGGAAFTGNLTVTDDRGGGLTCTATASAGAQVFTPPVASLAVGAVSNACAGDSATFAGSVTGGSGQFSYAWTPASCSGTSCTIDPSDSLFCAATSVQFTVNDAVCPSSSSQTGHYTKVTSISASVP